MLDQTFDQAVAGPGVPLRVSRPRLKDVAERAGVSVSTVSLVLNDVDGARVGEETRARVLETAATLGYRPNLLARSLQRQRTHLIGVVGEETATTPYAVRMLKGAQDAAWEAGYLLLSVEADGGTDMRREAVDALLDRSVEGVLLATMYHRIVEVPATLRAVPHVLLDCRPARRTASCVVPDEVGGATVAVSELVGAGHVRIGHVTDRLDPPAAGLRLKAFRQVLRAAGLAVDRSLVVADDATTDGGYRAAGRLLDQRRPPTGIFCFNDRMAMGAYRAAAERGLSIPDDLSIVGFDDMEVIADGLWPGLTTVALPHHEMGEWAFQTLTSIVEQRTPNEPTTHIMPCALVRRSSVAPPRSNHGKETR